MLVGEAFVIELQVALLVIVRVAGLVLSVPFFGSQGVPVMARVGLAVLVGLLLYPVLPPFAAPGDLFGYFVAVVQELAVGLGMGFMVAAAFAVINVAGQLMDIPMGFGMMNVIDPQTGAQIPVLAQFQHVLAILIFFTINGHHILFRALVDSYHWIPMGAMAVTGPMVETAIQSIAVLFVLALRISAPVLGATFLVNVALGILARAVPQINVFITGFPLKIITGLAILALVMPIYVALVGAVFGDGGEMMRLLWQFMRSI